MRLTRLSVWAYVAVMAVAFPVVQFEGDRWWFATVLIFGPMWTVLVPLGILTPLVFLFRARLVIPISVITLLYLFGPLGLRVGHPGRSTTSDSPATLSIVTLNAHVGTIDWNSLHAYLEDIQPHILVLQETGWKEFLNLPEEWNVTREGQLAVASVYPIIESRGWDVRERPRPQSALAAMYAVVDSPSGPLGVVNVHLITPRDGLNEVIDRRTILSPSDSDHLSELNYFRNRESRLLAQWIDELPRVDFVAGDFNMPVQSHIYRKWWSKYSNAFEQAGSGFGHTRRAGIRGIRWGVRIDHVLAGDHWTAQVCAVGPDVGSDHLPVAAILQSKK